MSKYSVFYQTHPNLKNNKMEKRVLNFIKRRMSFFLNEDVTFHYCKDVSTIENISINNKNEVIIK
jgi:hypothetical protein